MKYENGNAVVSFFDDILPSLDRDAKIALAQDLCFDYEVLNYFLDQLMTTYASENMDSHIHNARQRFVKLMPRAAAELVRSLNSEVQREKANEKFYRDYLFEIEAAWPEDARCPHCECNLHFRIPQRKEYPITDTPCSDQIMKACGFEPVALETAVSDPQVIAIREEEAREEVATHSQFGVGA